MTKRTVLFIDEVCYKPYDQKTLDTEALGGTEATVVRIAEGLAKTGLVNIIVEQSKRTITVDKGEGSVCYAELGYTSKADFVVCLRDPATAVKARIRFNSAKVYVLSEDLATRDLGLKLPEFYEAKVIKNICVSNFHKLQMIDTLIPYGYTGQFQNTVIYNPIDNDLLPDSTPINKNQIVWFSSPHKGLKQALELFKHLSGLCPELEFHVANPGYYADYVSDLPQVKFTGPLSHANAIKKVRESLCVFYPNMVFPETFGLVYAEANAVGTPVLTHKLGAAMEILDDNPDQFVDCRDNRAVIERVLKWRSGARPTVRSKSQFRLKNVLKEWVKLFNL